MATRRDPNEKSRRPPATTPEGRERQMIAYAVDLAERQMLNGTASAQVISHYLKLGSSREALEQERLANEVELLKIKRETIAAQVRIEEKYDAALKAMRAYSGNPDPEPDPNYDEHEAYYD